MLSRKVRNGVGSIRIPWVRLASVVGTCMPDVRIGAQTGWRQRHSRLR